jgi:hypothetical protein
MNGVSPRATVLIPAHDEAAVIARGLQPLALAAAAHFDIVGEGGEG